MITFKGHKELIVTVNKFNQDHVFKYWDELNEMERGKLLDELSNVDFDLMQRLYQQKEDAPDASNDFGPTPYIPLPNTKDELNQYEKARKAGIEFIGKGRMAALLVAGGQGTRLGFDGPKGMFPVGPVSNKSLFHIHAEKILKYSRKYGVSIPWLIMTSVANHEDTVNYFKDNGYFGLDKNDVIFFSQGMIPSLDAHGKLILDSKSSISKNPDGHGGTLTALKDSGALDDLKKRGIEEISYFQVDNPLVRIIDPVFIGHHILNNSHVSSKGVMKVDPQEKVGIFVKFANEKIGMVEYSDLSPEKQNARDNHGKLLFCMGNPAIHIFNLSFVDRLTSGGDISLPYHLARKKIESYVDGDVEKIDGLKFEKFIFDALPLTEKNTILETVREEEFAPVKNARGVDSVDTAKELMNNLSRNWLEQKSIKVPDDAENIEISPLLAVEPDDLGDDMVVPAQKDVYLEGKK